LEMVFLLAFLVLYSADGLGPDRLSRVDALVPLHNPNFVEVKDYKSLFAKGTNIYSNLPFTCYPDFGKLKNVTLDHAKCMAGQCNVPIADLPLTLALQFQLCESPEILQMKQFVCIDELSTALNSIGSFVKKWPVISPYWSKALSSAGLDPSNGCFRGPLEEVDFTHRTSFGYWDTPKVPVTPPIAFPELFAETYIWSSTKYPTSHNYSTEIKIYINFSPSLDVFNLNITVLHAIYTWGNTKSLKITSKYDPPEYTLKGII